MQLSWETQVLKLLLYGSIHHSGNKGCHVWHSTELKFYVVVVSVKSWMSLCFFHQQFIQQASQKPNEELLLTVPSSASMELFALMYYLRQNLQQFLHVPNYTDNKGDNHFQDTVEGHSVEIPESNAFLYNTPQGAGGKGQSNAPQVSPIYSMETHTLFPYMPRFTGINFVSDILCYKVTSARCIYYIKQVLKSLWLLGFLRALPVIMHPITIIYAELSMWLFFLGLSHRQL